MTGARFRDRADAGRQLAEALQRHGLDADVIVLGLPRGGVPVAFEVARVLQAVLDVLVVRKLGVPSNPELAMGAVGEGGTRVLQEDVVRTAGVSAEAIERVEAREQATLEATTAHLRQECPHVPLDGRTAVLVDDGIATGSTVRVAALVARASGAARIVVATPVGPRDVARRAGLGSLVDDVVCVVTDDAFGAVSRYYDDFAAVPDDVVIELLRRARG